MKEKIKNIIKEEFTEDSGKAYFKLRKQEKKTKGILHYYCLLRYHWMMQRYGCFLPFNAEISDTTIFPHGIYGCFVSQGAKIGSNCIIFHHVTIGSNTLQTAKKQGAPTIGNNVFIGAGAKIVGGIVIGDYARIGAGCVVTDNIPAGATVVMSKPRIIMHDEKRDNSFIVYTNGS